MTTGNLAPAAPIPTPANAGEALLAGRLSPHTRAAYASDLRQWRLFLERHGLTPPAARPEHVAAWRDALHAAGAATATVNRKLTVVRQLYAEAIARGELTSNPAARIPGFRGAGDSPTRGLTAAEARALLASPDRETLLGLRDYAMLRLLLHLGLRREELAGLRRRHLEQQQGVRTLTVTGKGQRRRLLKLPLVVDGALTTWLERAGPGDPEMPLFCRVRRWRTATGYGDRALPPQALSGQAVWYLVARHAQAAGLGDLHPHCLRHTFVTLALDGGAPLHKVQRAAGHADPRTTERYWRSKDDLTDAASDYVHL